VAKQTRISNTAAIVICQALTGLLDAGSDLKIYDGDIPTDLEVPLTTQNLLVQMSLPHPAFGTVVDGGGKASTSVTAIVAAVASASGLATFYRACNSGGDPVLQGTVGILNSDLNLSSTNIIAGVSVKVNSWNLHISEQQTVCP
jgi:hypothetical protein